MILDAAVEDLAPALGLRGRRAQPGDPLPPASPPSPRPARATTRPPRALTDGETAAVLDALNEERF